MERLEAGNHAQLAEARNILGADSFDMFNSGTRILV